MENDFSKDMAQVFKNYFKVSKKIINKTAKLKDSSQASLELEQKGFSEFISSAISISIILRELAADSLFGIQRALQKPLMSYAPFVLYRNLVELASYGYWMISTDINQRTRTERYMSYKYDSLVEKIKFLRSTGDLEEVTVIEEGLRSFVKKAESLELKVAKNKHDKVIGFGRMMPSSTELVNSFTENDSTYKIFSAVAHGKHWAIINSSFKVKKPNIYVFKGIRGGILEKNVDPIAIIYLCLFSIKSMTKLVAEQFKFFGWDEQPLLDLEKSIKIELMDITKKYNISITSL